MLGLLAVLVLVALPVYLLRRPKPSRMTAVDPVPRVEASAAAVVPEAGPPASALTDTSPNKRVSFAEPKTARCTPKGGGRATTERCERLPVFEEALARAIRDNVACAPPSAGPYTVSFVLSVDFDRKNTHLWAGRSGSLKKRSASDLIRCVEHAIVSPEWETVAHQFQKYDVNLIAAYPGAAASLPALGAPNNALGAPLIPAFGTTPVPSTPSPSYVAPAALGAGAPPALGTPVAPTAGAR